jgi:hypothetical protein
MFGEPGAFTEVAPVRFVPVMVTGTLVPRAPLLGLMVVSDGCGAFTVNATVPVVPNGVVTETVPAPSAALLAIANVAVIVPELVTATLVTVIPALDTLTVAGPLRFVPVRVTPKVLPCLPVAGLIDVSVGGPTTVNVTLPVVPPEVVILTLWGPSMVAGAMVNVALTVVAFTAVKLLTVMFGEFTTVTAVVPNRLVPVSVTTTVVPANPDDGEIDVNVGGGLTPWNSTAPMSK